jgi:predicted metal-dependent phosphoesterase TrpH
MIDLHSHTTASDGTYTPTELIQYAIEKKLNALAITDHDTIDGLAEAGNYLATQATTSNLKLINGIELSTNIPKYPFDIHILGLYINPHDPIFLEGLKTILEDRNRRNKVMISLIQKNGYNITMNDIIDYSKDSVVTRAHVAKVLVSKGYFQTTGEVFNKLIGNNKPAYVPRDNVHAKFAIECIKNSGGIPVIAHPTLYGLSSNGLYALIDELKTYGLMGIECYYSLYSKLQTQAMIHIAKRFDLFETGGSDFHGLNKPDTDLGNGLGKLIIPDSLLQPLEDYLAKR